MKYIKRVQTTEKIILVAYIYFSQVSLLLSIDIIDKKQVGEINEMLKLLPQHGFQRISGILP